VKEPSNSDKVGPDIFPFGDESSVESDNLADAEVLTQKSSKTSKPPSNNSAKSPQILTLMLPETQH